MINAGSPHVAAGSKKREKTVRRWVNANLLLIFVVVDILSVIATAWSFSRPTEVVTQVLAQQIRHQVSFEHLAQMRQSSLYPSPQLLSQQQRYVVKLMDHFYVSVKANATINSATNVSGSVRVVLKLIAGELWEREYVLAEERPFTGTGEIQLLNDTYEIPISQLWAFVDTVGKEADIRPGNYTLSVIPIIVTDLGKADVLPQEFCPSYSFELSERELVPRGALMINGSNPTSSLHQEKTYSEQATNVAPSVMRFLLWEIQVTHARWILVALTSVLVCATLLVRRRYPSVRSALAEAQSISRKYRSRIVTAAGAVSIKGLTMVPLKSFRELLAIADEREKTIICLDDPAAKGKLCRFCVMDEWTVFCYQALTELPDSPSEECVVTGAVGGVDS